MVLVDISKFEKRGENLMDGDPGSILLKFNSMP